jgi:hypothetical protein
MENDVLNRQPLPAYVLLVLFVMGGILALEAYNLILVGAYGRALAGLTTYALIGLACVVTSPRKSN